jgi:hypothetical protein
LSKPNATGEWARAPPEVPPSALPEAQHGAAKTGPRAPPRRPPRGARTDCGGGPRELARRRRNDGDALRRLMVAHSDAGVTEGAARRGVRSIAALTPGSDG